MATKSWKEEITDELLSFATENQAARLAVILECGSLAEAARRIGIHERSLYKIVAAVKNKAAKRGHAPECDMTVTVPDGYQVKGTSTLYKDGQVALQWVKTSIDHQQQAEMMQAAIEAMCEDIPREPVSEPCVNITDAALVSQYTFTDHHFGMLAWGKENLQADYDLEEAERLLVQWFKRAIEVSPNAKTAIMAQLGDLLHADGLTPETPSSGHTLDADSRFSKVVRVVIRVIRQVIAMLLQKHEFVRVIMAEGNHDLSASVWLREMLGALYENEPRVSVDNSASPYYMFKHGRTVLFYHHGHLSKFDKVASVMAGMFRKEYGESDFAYCHMGHLHHDKLQEGNLMTVEQHQTLAARDAYASRGGWLSGRSAKVITYHDKYGEVGRSTINFEMIG